MDKKQGFPTANAGLEQEQFSTLVRGLSSDQIVPAQSTDPWDVARLVDQALLPVEGDQEDEPRDDAVPDLLTLGVSDEGNAEAVTLLYPDRLAFTESHGWLSCADGYWSTEKAEATADRIIVDTLKARIQAARDTDADAFDKVIRFCVPNSGRVKGTQHLLRSKVALSQSAFDASPDLLNCPNGVVDLRTGELIPHSPAYRFMHIAGVEYDPEASYAEFSDWLTSAVGDEAVARWLQRAVGYTLTGCTSEEVLFYLYGPPRSGKGIFLETLRRVMGDQLAKAIPFSVLTSKTEVDTQNFALAPLKPTRLVLASESNSYERFNEAKLKAITGGDAISCAFKHRDAFTYRPQFKVWLSSNRPVNADPDDEAVWGRIRVIPFPNTHLGREDKTLKDRIKANPKGVLAWAVAGARDWYGSLPKGLPELQDLVVLKDSQRNELDHVAQWLDERCSLIPEHFTPTAELYGSYSDWCRSNGVTARQLGAFSTSLKAKGLVNAQQRVSGKVNAVRGFRGLALVTRHAL